ncbi:hypothetical protein [Bradyrhizobium sacchari]|uniref:Secreted protein n=1 Tax=Bradyrhizobium sacchari TaxID=1399419 RepID=A0A560I9L9_9BRAD|nr:hypothetical protein [Bradyrhizobium sacchari]TWB55703.1 hypothetical protein FBZ94_107220 [Bradyrhizobium sacchari]TWB78988.1 hypothetical protein FBZ95_103839 [Bradyrhizobium sacchari]
MTRTVNFARASILALPLLVALCSVARCDDPAESSRESIIQNVREDVRRHIRAQQTQEAGKPSKSTELSPAATQRRVTKKRNRTVTSYRD